MPSQYSTDLRIELIQTGEQSGTWGNTTNTNLGTIIEDAISGLAVVSILSANQALTALNGAGDQARCAAISLTTTTAPFNVYVPPVTKLYVVENASAYAATIYASTFIGNTTAAGAGVIIPAGKSVLLRVDTTNSPTINVVEQLNHVVGNLSIGSVLGVSGIASITGSAYLGASQTATITSASPAVITVANSPINDTAVRFTTTGTLPSPLTNTTTYYVINRTATTFNVSTSIGGGAVNTLTSGSGTHTVTTVSLASTAPAGTDNTQVATTEFVNLALSNLNITNWAIDETFADQTATITIASPAVVTVATAPANNTAVSFSTTGTLPTGITAGTPYYVVNRTSTTFEISATSGGASINFTDTESGTHTVTAYTPVNTSGTQSGVHTETTSKLYFKYKSQNRMSVDLGGNAVLFGNVTAYGSV